MRPPVATRLFRIRCSLSKDIANAGLNGDLGGHHVVFESPSKPPWSARGHLTGSPLGHGITFQQLVDMLMLGKDGKPGEIVLFDANGKLAVRLTAFPDKENFQPASAPPLRAAHSHLELVDAGGGPGVWLGSNGVVACVTLELMGADGAPAAVLDPHRLAVPNLVVGTAGNDGAIQVFDGKHPPANLLISTSVVDISASQKLVAVRGNGELQTTHLRCYRRGAMARPAHCTSIAIS